MLGSLREAFNIPHGKEWKKESAVGKFGPRPMYGEWRCS